MVRIQSFPTLPAKPSYLWIGYLLLVIGLTILALVLSQPASLQIRHSDETLYYTVARNIFHSFDFNSHHYLADSLLLRGYPTKDSHLPGYPLLVALSCFIWGETEQAPIYLNYGLLCGTTVLMFAIGKRLSNAGMALLAVVLYLAYPLVLPLAHNVMTETVASAIVVAIVAVFLFLKEHFLKGMLLGLLMVFAYLVKPFLIAFLTAALVVLLVYRHRCHRATWLGMVTTVAALAPTVILPLSSHQEYYPYSASFILAEPGLLAKAIKAQQNFSKNIRYLFLALEFGQFGRPTYLSGSMMQFVLLGILTLPALPLTIIAWFKHWKTHCEELIRQNVALAVFTGAFLQVLALIAVLYEFHAWRLFRSTLCFVPVLAILLSVCLFQLIRSPHSLRLPLPTGFLSRYFPSLHKVLQRGAIDNLTLSLPVRLGILTTVVILLLTLTVQSGLAVKTFHEQAQAKEGNVLRGATDRVTHVIQQYKLQPHVVMSFKNFYFPVAHYPSQIIWLLPETVQALAEIEQRVPVDLIELQRTDRLYQDNLKLTGTPERLGNHHTLIHQQGNYFYYKRL